MRLRGSFSVCVPKRGRSPPPVPFPDSASSPGRESRPAQHAQHPGTPLGANDPCHETNPRTVLGSLRGETPQERGSKGVSPLTRFLPAKGSSLLARPSLQEPSARKRCLHLTPPAASNRASRHRQATHISRPSTTLFTSPSLIPSTTTTFRLLVWPFSIDTRLLLTPWTSLFSGIDYKGVCA